MSNEIERIVTPPGELHFVNISGQGKANYNQTGYVYTATIYVKTDLPATKKMIEQIENIVGELKGKQRRKSIGYRDVLEDSDGRYVPTAMTTERDEGAKPTGLTAFSFSSITTFPDGKKKIIHVYDAAQPKPKKIDLKGQKVGNGSIGAISGNLKKYTSGLDVGPSLFINNLQLINFIPYEEDAGFEGQEDGYVGQDEASDFSAEPETAEEEAPAKTSKPRL